MEHLAKAQKVSGVHQSKLTKAIPDLLAYAMRVEDIMHVPPTLLDLGVHFVIVPHLPGTYVDGAAIYLDGNSNQPVVAITLRYDRIDAFWFTLMHELAHIILEHEAVLDERIFEEHNGDSKEDKADRFACEHLVDPTAFSAFVKNVKPYFSKSAIDRFAETQGRVTWIVLGQLQYKGIVGYQHLRPLLVKAKPHLEDWIDCPGCVSIK